MDIVWSRIMAWKDDINIPLLSALGLLGGAILVVTLLLTHAGYLKVKHSQLEYRYAEQEKSASFAQAIYDSQLSGLTQTRPANVSETAFQIPIEQAKQAIVAAKGNVSLVKP
jgi:hypothetical protein